MVKVAAFEHGFRGVRSSSLGSKPPKSLNKEIGSRYQVVQLKTEVNYRLTSNFLISLHFLVFVLFKSTSVLPLGGFFFSVPSVQKFPKKLGVSKKVSQKFLVFAFREKNGTCKEFVQKFGHLTS